MHNRLKFYFILLIIIVPELGIMAQHEDQVISSGHEDHDPGAGHKGHKITLIMGNSLIDNSFSDQSNQILIVPTFGFNYDFFINSKWGLGVHTDILLQQFKVEKHGSHEEIIRENPIGLMGMALFKPHHRWILLAGYGIEIEKHENFQMIKAGVEYGLALPKHWEVGFGLEFNYKIKTSNSLMFGIGFSKMLGK